MSYEKDSIKDAKKLGAFDDNVLDPKILQMSQEEKSKLSDNLARVKKDMVGDKPAASQPSPMRKKKKDNSAFDDVELSFFEKIVMFFLSILGFSSPEQYKKKKVIKSIEKDMARIKPPVYHIATRRISKFFAHKLHDLYLKIVWIKKIMDRTLNNKKFWDNPDVPKTVAESLFERLANINTDEVDSNFSPSGIEMVVSQFEDPRKAAETIEKSFYSYVYSIDKTLIDKVNDTYTNLVYFKNLCEFDFHALFKRFDPTFHPGVTPNFIDIPGEGIIAALQTLEENILQIDLTVDNIFIFKKLYAVSNEFGDKDLDTVPTPGDDTMAKIDPKTTAIKGIEDGITPEKLEADLLILIEILKELLYTKSITLLIQIIKLDPLYSPSLVHSRYDLFKVYLETFEKRIKLVSKNVVKLKRKRNLESIYHQLFGQTKWVGMYNLELSDEIEKIGFTGFFFTFHVGAIALFLERYYNDFLKNAINILLLNGVFSEKNFHKMTSDTFYALDKFVERFNEFAEEVSPEGTEGKRLLTLLGRKDSVLAENRKLVEKHIVSINGKARDLFEEFQRHFSSVHTIISKVYKDIDPKPPKFIRNIRAIGGFRNVKFLQTLEKGMKILQGMQELVNLLKQ